MLTILALSGCDAMKPPVEEPRSAYVRMPAPPLDSLRAAPETIDVADARITAGAVLWLNRSPGPRIRVRTRSPGLPLRGAIDVHRVDTLDGRPFPAGIALQGAWLRAGDSIWALAVAPADTTRATGRGLAQEVWTGPPWLRRDSRVDVVLRLRRPDGAPALLQVRDVPVQVVS